MSLINELKSEITRLARKEIRKEVESLRRVNATQRSQIAGLRTELAEIKRMVKRLEKVSPVEEVIEAEQQDKRKGFWITGKGIKSLRNKLGITQVELAKLADVSEQTVVGWGKVLNARAW